MSGLNAAKEMSLVVAAAVEDWFEAGLPYDVSFNKTALLTYVKNSGAMDPETSKEIMKQYQHAQNNTFKGYGPFETFNFEPITGFSRTKWYMKEHVITAQWSVQDIGYDTKLFEVVQTIKNVTNKSLSNKINGLAWTSVEDPETSDTATGFPRLIDMVDGGRETYPIIGGLDRRDLPWLNSIVKRPGRSYPRINREDVTQPWVITTDPNVVPNPFTGNAADAWQLLDISLIDEMIDLLRASHDGDIVCFTTTKINRGLIDRLKAANAYTSNVAPDLALLKGGHEAVEYRRVMFMVDERIADGDMWFLNFNKDDGGMRMIYHPDFWLTLNEPMKPINQHAWYMAIDAWFQWVLRDPTSCGRITKVATEAVTPV